MNCFYYLCKVQQKQPATKTGVRNIFCLLQGAGQAKAPRRVFAWIPYTKGFFSPTKTMINSELKPIFPAGYVSGLADSVPVMYYGESMKPKYLHGCILLCKPCNPAGALLPGVVYLAESTLKGSKVVGRFKSKTPAGAITLIPDNSDFGPYVLQPNEIQAFARVVGSLMVEE